MAGVKLDPDVEEWRKKVGFPDFDTWKRNRHLYKEVHDMWAAAADEGRLTTNYKDQKHYVRLPSGAIYSCGKSKERVEAVFKNEGYDWRHVFFRAEIMEGVPLPWVKVTWEVRSDAVHQSKKVIL